MSVKNLSEATDRKATKLSTLPPTDAEYKKRFIDLCVEMAVRMADGEQELSELNKEPKL